MASTGESIAKTFIIPQYPNQATPSGSLGRAPEAFDDGVRALDGLQTVSNQTSDYYRKVAALKSFMQEAHNNLGLDVRVPDYSKGEMSIKLNELYNKAIADIMAQGNLLRNSHSRAENLINQHARFITDPNSKPAELMQYGKDYTLESASPFVKERNDQIKALYDSGDYAGAQAKYQEVSDYLDRRAKENPEIARLFELDKLALEPPRKGVFRPTTSNWQERLYGKQTETAGAFVKDIAHIVNMARTFEIDPNTGKLMNYEYTGTTVGQTPDGKLVTIKGWEGNQDGSADLLLSNGKRISGKNDIATIIRMIARAKGQDKGFGMDHLEQYLHDNNFNDTDTQEANTRRIMESEGGIDKRTKKPLWQLKQEENLRASADYEQAQLKPAEEGLHEELINFKQPINWLPDFLGGAGEVKTLGGYKIQNNGKNGYNILNLQEKMPSFKTKIASQNYYATNHHFNTIEELEAFLKENGVHIEEYKKKKQAAIQGQIGTSPKAAPTLAPGSLD